MRIFILFENVNIQEINLVKVKSFEKERERERNCLAKKIYLSEKISLSKAKNFT